MGDTEKISTTITRRLAAAVVLRRLCRKIQKQAYKNMRFPSDPAAKLIALNTVNNIFDRLDEAIDHYIKENEHGDTNDKCATDGKPSHPQDDAGHHTDFTGSV